MTDIHHRPRIAMRIRELLLRELGETIDVGLMLGPPEYARAVVSLCRGSRNAELLALGDAFLAASDADHAAQRARVAQQGLLVPHSRRAAGDVRA
jgi:hypothetical protein